MGGTPKAKAGFWAFPDTARTKAWGAKGIRYPCSPRRKRWMLGAGSFDPFSAGY